jgi:hypothetical protein
MAKEHEGQTKGLLHKLAKALEGIEEKGDADAPHSGDAAAASGLFELAAAEGPYEKVLICRSLGTATVYIRGKDLYIVPNGKLNRLNGAAIGNYVGVFKSKLGADLFKFPDAPSAPYDKPSPIPDFRSQLNPTKAVWRLKWGSIFAVGPANSYVIPLRDKSAQLVISIAMVITGGTRRYEGARGTISSLGATWFPYVPGLTLDKTLKDGAVFEAKGVHGMRITLEKYQAPAPSGGEEEEEEEPAEDEDDEGDGESY